MCSVFPWRKARLTGSMESPSLRNDPQTIGFRWEFDRQRIANKQDSDRMVMI